MPQRLLPCLLLVSPLLWGDVVLASPAPPTGAPERVTPAPPRRPAPPKPWARGVSASQRATALGHFKAGNYFLVRSQYAKALAKYRQAVKHWNHPAIRYNMTVCLVELDRYLEAHRSLKAALKYGAAPLGPELFRQARMARKLLLGRLARLHVVCSEPDAQVSVGGGKPERCDRFKARWVVPGKQVIVVRKPGFLTATKGPILLGGRVQRVVVKLVRVETAFQMKRRWPRWIPWITLGLGAAVGLAGMPLLLVARSDIRDYDSKIASLCAEGGCAPGTVPSSVTDIEKRAQVKNAAGYVLIGLGGAAAAAGIALVILNQPRAVRTGHKPEQPRVSVLPTGTGITATFRF